MKADAVRGHLDAMLLAVLEPGPLHGYAVITAVQQRSGGVLELRTGTVYPALNRLERLGLLHSRWQPVSDRPRRCYELTDAGRRSLAAERSTWQDFTTAISAVLDLATPAGRTT
ncbi:DNA-binding PadR family transcriptional regulator [Saccharothrix ecbatanensis]|uniref:DNA-binding PadR family transcriptional regulator n=1 Tax=Saccharothrix ecbatanensis TaxID=1105145 RepID=A0A7W9M119_9PSEU|nr:helix-turn-helix transcriptional regulator [Saccharothrix ecbatanensis]MBB5803441.1 DNA-binding PadR family transcriptional regulator [Saccharothrix ecbatanensis]